MNKHRLGIPTLPSLRTLDGAQVSRIRELKPTERGRRILDKILSAAGRRLWEGIPTPGRIRQVKEATEHLRKANRILRGPFQLTFFDKDLFLEDQKRTPRKRSPAGARGLSMGILK